MMAEKGGLTKLDVSVLNAEQQEKLRQFKIKTRIDNEKYLRSHPEVELLIGDFLRDVLLKRPTDIHEFAAGELCTVCINTKTRIASWSHLFIHLFLHAVNTFFHKLQCSSFSY
uniref:RIIa domain-containing protein n=1 Tax=Amphilophus citrinellus TaxID=61819 RepID=A0A3Q0RWG9_AMPCI